MLAVPLAVLHELKLFLHGLPVLLGSVIAPLALGALEGDNFDVLLLLGRHGSLSFQGGARCRTSARNH